MHARKHPRSQTHKDAFWAAVRRRPLRVWYGTRLLKAWVVMAMIVWFTMATNEWKRKGKTDMSKGDCIIGTERERERSNLSIIHPTVTWNLPTLAEKNCKYEDDSNGVKTVRKSKQKSKCLIAHILLYLIEFSHPLTCKLILSMLSCETIVFIICILYTVCIKNSRRRLYLPKYILYNTVSTYCNTVLYVCMYNIDRQI